jgi:hypothetical protein
MGERVEDRPQQGRVGEGEDAASAEDLTMTAAPSPGGAGSGARRARSSEFSGRTLAHFEMLELVGAGGFGEVYRARDTRLDRIVAIKILPQEFAVDAERRERFRREAVAASALNHPHICTVHELVEADGHFLIVMELVEGQTLHERLKAGPMPVAEALPIAIQVADALGEAHRAGIVHRDVKCRNIALTKRGQVKVLDFGLAKLLDFGTQPDAQTLEKLTADGTTSGTPGYMSPEQLLARPLDRRSDLFSFGVVLYRMATGRLPFEGTSAIALANAILNAEPHDFGDGPVPEKLKAIIRKLLQKDPEKRYSSAEEVEGELKALEAELAPARRAGLSGTAWVAVAVGLVVVVSVGGWYVHRGSRERWALKATAKITRLLEAEEFTKAAALIQEARAILPTDPTLEKLWMDATGEASIESEPSGADVSVLRYDGAPNDWENLGRTPLKAVRIPHGVYLWRIAKPGFAETRTLFVATLERKFQLRAERGVPAGMVPVAGGRAVLGSALVDAPKVQLDGFLVDRTEVTNEEFKKFVDAGGYRSRAFWKEPFREEGREVPWEEGIARFVDATGRPGPATWEVGSSPKELAKHPVAGVSWYEAAAYAVFAGKSLPTVYHWTLAAQTYMARLVAPGSNFRGAGTQPVGRPGTLSGAGTTDMAGNVKEWCWNERRDGKRFIFGGGFGEPTYAFVQTDVQSPWDRQPNYGFRCIKAPGPAQLEGTARLDASFRDYWKETPVSEEVFRAYRGLFSYDKAAPNAKVEEKRSTADWAWEKVTVDAAYGGERLTLHMFLPKGVAPPFQVVVYFPGSDVFASRRFDPSVIEGDMDFLPKSGRALVWPIYKGTFERNGDLKHGGPSANPAALWRDHVIAWEKEVGRTLDYLETRSDLDVGRAGYLGRSLGGAIAPIILAVDERFEAAVLVSGGLHAGKPLPEVDPVNYIRRAKTPTLMVNGRYDSFFSLESSQVPLFRLLGTPDKDKRHVLLECGHGLSPWKDVIRESLAWLDKHLGPVTR